MSSGVSICSGWLWRGARASADIDWSRTLGRVWVACLPSGDGGQQGDVRSDAKATEKPGILIQEAEAEFQKRDFFCS